MKCYFTKLTALLLSFLIMSSLCVTGIHAEDDSSNNSALIAYTTEVLPQVLALHDINVLESPDAIILGRAVPTYYIDGAVLKNAECEMFPLFINGTVRAIIRRHIKSDGSVGYSCRLDAREIYNINANEGAFVYLDGKPYLINSRTISVNSVSLSNNPLISASNIATIQYATLSPQNGTPISLPAVAMLSNAEEDEIVVPLVWNLDANNTPSCCGGLCWAACFASLANHFANGSYTAYSFHNSVNCSLFNRDYETYTIVFLRNAGVNTPQYFNYLGLTYNRLKGYIDEGSVALLHVWDEETNYSHYVIAYGYLKTSSGVKRVKYMDPNEGRCITDIPSSGVLEILVNGIVWCEEWAHLECY